MHLTKQQHDAMCDLVACETADEVAELLEDAGVMGEADASAMDVYLRDLVLGGEPWRVETVARDYYTFFQVWCGDQPILDCHRASDAMEAFAFTQGMHGGYHHLKDYGITFEKDLPGWTEEEERAAQREKKDLTAAAEVS